MTDEIELLREARPPAAGPDPELARRARAQLLTEITGTPAARRWTSRRALPIALPALTAVVAAVVLGVTLLERGGGSAWAAALVEVAEAAPRLLVDESGWQVTRADEFSVDFGEMTFANGERQLELRWRPAGEYEDLVADRAAKVDEATTAPVAGAEARLFRYEGTNDFTALWVQGDYAIEVRGLAPDRDAFRAVLATLEVVDVDTWLSAMPESVVKPASRAEVVRAMLADIPLPTGFDAAVLTSGNAVRDRYQLGAQVAGAVACAWLEQWREARSAGNGASAREAVDAMATSRSWAVLAEMDEEGDYPEVLWQYADAMATDGAVAGGKRSITVEESYAGALGCESR